MLKDKNGNQIMIGDTVAYATKEADSCIIRVATVIRIVLDINYGDRLGRVLVRYEGPGRNLQTPYHFATIFRWNEILVLRRAG